MFGSFVDILGVDYAPTAAEQKFSSDLRGYWTRFAANGEPNRGGAVPWPRFRKHSEKFLRLDEDFRAGASYKEQACDLLSPN